MLYVPKAHPGFESQSLRHLLFNEKICVCLFVAMLCLPFSLKSFSKKSLYDSYDNMLDLINRASGQQELCLKTRQMSIRQWTGQPTDDVRRCDRVDKRMKVAQISFN